MYAFCLVAKRWYYGHDAPNYIVAALFIISLFVIYSVFSDGKCRIEFDPTITDPSKIAGKIFNPNIPCRVYKIGNVFLIYLFFFKKWL